MAEPQRARKQMIGLILTASAGVLGLVAVLLYTGTIPLAQESRGIAAMAVGAAAAADFVAGLWFFRMGQSS